MKRITSLATAALAVGLTAFAQAAPDQPAPGAQAVDPSAPDESTSAPPVGPDARSGTSSAEAAAPAAEPNTRLAALTPPGMSTEEACAGFKSLTECAAALHAAQNLGIPYADLKSRLTAGRRLTAAIHELKPGTNAGEQARRAEDQARSDVRAPQG